MDECLETLDKTKECQNDVVLVEQVRLQLIVEKTVMPHPGQGDSEFVFPHLASLFSQLQSLESRLLANFQDNGKAQPIRLSAVQFCNSRHCRGGALTPA